MAIFWRMFWEINLALLKGLVLTLKVSILGMALALLIGLAVGLGRLYGGRGLRWAMAAYTEFCRDTPIFVQLLWVNYVWPEALGLDWSATTSAVIALTLQTSGYLAETFRAGIGSLPGGQTEAALSTGLRRSQIVRWVIFPQAVRRVLPGLLNQFVTCLKSSSLVSVIAVADLMYEASRLVSLWIQPTAIYTLAALYYFVIVLGLSVGIRKVTGVPAMRAAV